MGNNKKLILNCDFPLGNLSLGEILLGKLFFNFQKRLEGDLQKDKKELIIKFQELFRSFKNLTGKNEEYNRDRLETVEALSALSSSHNLFDILEEVISLIKVDVIFNIQKNLDEYDNRLLSKLKQLNLTR